MSRPIPAAALAAAMCVPLLGSLIYFVWIPEGAMGKSAYTATKLFTLVFPLLFLKQMGAPRLPPKGTCWCSALTWGIGSGLAISAAGWVLYISPLGDVIRDSASAVVARAEGLGFKDHFLTFTIFVSFFHSALEEFYWRWFVFGGLKESLSLPLAHLLAAASFAAHHLVVTLQFFPIPMAIFLAICVGVGGFIWSWLYQRQGGLLSCWLSHMLVDVFLMYIGYLLIFGV